MKFLVLTILTMAAFSARAEIGPVGRSTSMKYDGTPDANSLEKRFINVINSSDASIAAGKAVVLDLADDDGASVTVSATAGQSPLCVMVAACADNALCKCQTYGKMDAALFDSTGANAVAGSRWYMASSGTAGYISARGTSLATEIPGGIFYDSASASASVEIWIDL